MRTMRNPSAPMFDTLSEMYRFIPWISAVTAISVVVARMMPSSVRKLRSLFRSDAEPVGTHVRHFVGDVQIHTMDQRRDSDQRGGGQNDAEQRQETAQLVLVQ